MPLVKSIIELTLTPLLFIIVGTAKIVEHYKMVDDINASHNK